MLAACTSESENGPSANISYESIAATQQVPVTFGTYIGDQATTRAGYVGPINSDATLRTSGVEFGVFGYYTNAGNYDSNSSTGSDINFMYNQKVTYSTSWTYSPIKYQPNESATSNIDQHSASTVGGTDKLTFFAYAPFVTVTSGTGAPADASYGITALPGNTIKGDPKVSYKLSDDALNSVDLLWAVAPSNQTTPTVAGGNWGNVLAGMPYIDLVKPELTSGPVSTPINFSFKHALSRLALTVQATRDKDVVDGSLVELWDDAVGAANKTKIVIDYVKLTGNFPIQGDLNLNNASSNTPKWENLKYYDLGAPGTPSSTVGLKEILINTSNGNLATSLRVDNASTPGTAASQPDGVLVKSSTELLEKTATPASRYFMFIPDNTNLTSIDVEIRYFVITDDTNLSGGKSVIENKIKKTVSVIPPAVLFEAGKAYTWNLTLGMETVSIAATVVPWSDQSATPVDLPLNVAPAAP